MVHSHLHIAAISILSIALVTTGARAAGRGSMGGGGGMHVGGGAMRAGGGGIHVGGGGMHLGGGGMRFGGGMPRGFAAPHISSMPRHFSSSRIGAMPHLSSAPRHFSTPRISSAPHIAAHGSVNRHAGSIAAAQHTGSALSAAGAREPHLAARNLAGQAAAGRALRVAGSAASGAHVLHNPALANRLHGGTLAGSTFKGAFLDHHRHFHNRFFFFPVFVVGWVGPLFWPYAYYDFLDYTFYPYAYDVFWPYAYDDVYFGMFGPYGYGYSAYAQDARGGRAGPRLARAGGGGRSIETGNGGRSVETDVCTGETAGLTDWPVERISETINPDDAQRTALDELKGATAKAVDILRAACPTDLPSTPTGRINAMHQRLDAMLAAVRTVRPALDKLYQSLSDEQKARFNALEPEEGEQGQRQSQRDLAQLCGERAAGIASLPLARIERTVRPDETQRVALRELQDATAQAVDLLHSSCPTYRALTPVGRLEAMEQRLGTMLQAVQTVQPALEKFYGALSDEQKERFNRLSPAQS